MSVYDLRYIVRIYAVSSHMFMHTWSSPIGDGGSLGKITPISKMVSHAYRVVSRTLHAYESM